MKKFHISLIACLILTMVIVNSSFAQTISIDGITVRGAPVDGNLVEGSLTTTTLGPFPITPSYPLGQPIGNLNIGYVYKIDVLSVDFLTSFGIHGYEYLDQNPTPRASSESQPSFMHEGRRWSLASLAYHPTWDGDHFLRIQALTIDPYGSAVRFNQGYVFVNVHRWSIEKNQTDYVPLVCGQGKCSYSHTFGQTYCRDSAPTCNGGECGSPGCP